MPISPSKIFFRPCAPELLPAGAQGLTKNHKAHKSNALVYRRQTWMVNSVLISELPTKIPCHDFKIPLKVVEMATRGQLPAILVSQHFFFTDKSEVWFRSKASAKFTLSKLSMCSSAVTTCSNMFWHISLNWNILRTNPYMFSFVQCSEFSKINMGLWIFKSIRHKNTDRTKANKEFQGTDWLLTTFSNCDFWVVPSLSDVCFCLCVKGLKGPKGSILVWMTPCAMIL